MSASDPCRYANERKDDMNSRQLAKRWPFPRHKLFEKELRNAATRWFQDRGYPTHSRMSYCLRHWNDWKNNIILLEVSEYIEKTKNECEQKGKPFPLHKYLHHGLSSQAMAFNLIGPLITRNDYEPLIQVIQENGIENGKHIDSAVFEYEDRSVFNEDSGQPTSIDIVLTDSKRTPVFFIESKLVEKEFGGCSVFSEGDCNGENPISNKKQCFLHFIGRKYWELMDKYGFSEILREEKQCVFVAYYQFFREVLFALEKGGVFILLSDERSPVFYCEANGIEKGLMAFLLKFVPSHHANRIASISIQKLVQKIKESKKHNDWIEEFESKYGLA